MSTALPRLARIDDASRIHGLLWASRKEIGLKDNFVDQSHMNWVRERCAAGEVLVVDREGAIASVMVLRSEDNRVRQGPGFKFSTFSPGSARVSRIAAR